MFEWPALQDLPLIGLLLRRPLADVQTLRRQMLLPDDGRAVRGCPAPWCAHERPAVGETHARRNVRAGRKQQ
jgi:hypothetical protein